jgi:hypothetical protein
MGVALFVLVSGFQYAAGAAVAPPRSPTATAGRFSATERSARKIFSGAGVIAGAAAYLKGDRRIPWGRMA